MDKAMHSEFEGHKKRIEKDAEIWCFAHIHEPFGLSPQEGYIAGATIERINLSEENQSLRSELQKQKELNAELVEGLKMSRDLMKTHVPSSQTGLYVEWIEARDIIESLIKKYKESWK